MIRRRSHGKRLSRLDWLSSHKLQTTFWLAAILLVIFVIYQADNYYAPNKRDLSVDRTHELHVVTRVGLNTYYDTPDGPTGFEFSLLSRFADYLDKELVIHTANSLEEVFRLLQIGKVSFASAGLTPTEDRKNHYRFSIPYLSDQPIVVYKVGNRRPRLNSQLRDRDIVVVANSSHAEALMELKTKTPDLSWRETTKSSYFELLQRVESGEFSYVIMDQSEFTQLQGFFPSLKRAMNLGDQLPVSWMFSRRISDTVLLKKANAFIKQLHESGELDRLEEQYFGHAKHITQDEAHEFAKNLKRRLPKYLPLIQEVAENQGIDWRLLAAISYQESRWNPRAKSPTGVRGMMMLTLTTAKELGVTNRLDVEQSLNGGARYFLRLRDNLPDRIPEPDRSWFALASYNVGRGHLEDARRLTEQKNMDPDSWFAVKQTLPLLSDPEWHSRTRYGYARGHEPVHYVQQIRYYYNVLSHDKLGDLLSIPDDFGSDFIVPEQPDQEETDAQTM